MWDRCASYGFGLIFSVEKNSQGKSVDKELAITKLWVNFLCCFVPLKKWRKKIRYDLADRKRRRKELLELGFGIDDGIITTPQGVRMDISDKSDRPLYLIKEVFVKSEYNLKLKRDSILIDIGMNRAAASLLFATNENIKKIYSYEPFKPTFEVAKRNLELNPQLSKKINVLNFGLGKAETTLELPYVSNASGAMSTTHNICRDENTRTETVIIKDAAEQVAAILEENKNKHVIIKCDCEGAEYEIFERLNEKGLVSKVDIVMMEYHFEKPEELVNIFTENGFAVQTKVGSKKSKTGYIYAVRMADRICCQ